MSGWKDSFRHHRPEDVDDLLAWCERGAEAHPEQVAAVGLAYVYGLNEHQIAVVTVTGLDPVSIEFPCARRASAIARAERRPLARIEPDWLAAAIAKLASARTLPCRLLRPRNRMSIPVGAGSVRTLVAGAGKEACGIHVSPLTLNGSRTYELQRLGLPLALHGIGHAPAWASRLALARPVLLAPRRKP